MSGTSFRKETRGKWSISLGAQCAESRYEKYLEAWDLLRRPEFNGDIKACAEEFPVPFDDACQLRMLVESGRQGEPCMVFAGD
jgi:hypothetical protein